MKLRRFVRSAGAFAVCLLAFATPVAMRAQTVPAPFSLNIPPARDWMFDSEHPVRFALELLAPAPVPAGRLRMEVTTDFGRSAASIDVPYLFAADSVVPGGAFRCRADVAVDGLAPGFYRTAVLSGGDTLCRFSFGFEPEKIVSAPDARRGFERFWRRTLAELRRVDPRYRMTLLPDSSTPRREVYEVEMQSLDGETLRGYWAVPTDEDRHPAVVVYQGYGAVTWIPGPNDYPGWCVLVIPPRGQGLNLPFNRFGEWIACGLDAPRNYYYRGAYADAVRSNDFVCSQPGFDGIHLFVTGISQGGGIAMAAASLDRRIAAAAPIVPFLGDFPDYFRMADWPACLVRKGAWEQNVAPRRVYEVLSYFDLKNLTGNIRCPLLMGFGLQDDITPPHTNFAAYNPVRSPKRWICYPLSGHLAAYENRDLWIAESTRFFREQLK